MAIDRAKRFRNLVYALDYARGAQSLDTAQLAALRGWLERELEAMTEEDQMRTSILDPFSDTKGLIDLPVVAGSTLPPRLWVA
ncbi:hypothetical protein LCGC14_0557880 [marine sediment metagenome]|uniref:Uncharacterized protein n=1 Tax=marine sediment metagenome TaxID=412755 RepID=A0A0F9RMU2_9ZZZZ